MSRTTRHSSTAVKVHGACGVCFDYLLLSDGVCLSCSISKGR